MEMDAFVEKLNKKINQGLNVMKNNPWKTVFFILVLCLSFGLKLTELNTGLQHEFPGSDPYASNQNAIDVLNGTADINFYLNPLMGLYLLFIYSVFGISKGLWIAKFIQILASFVIPFFMYYVVKRYFGETAGYIASILALIHPSLIFYSAHTWSEFWIIFLFCAMLYLFVRALEEKKGNMRRGFLIGLFTGIASLGKIWMGVIGAALILFILFEHYSKKDVVKSLTQMVYVGGLAFLGVILILVPWIIYASATAGFFVFVNINSQTNLYIGNNPQGEIAFTSRAYYGYEPTYSTNIKDGNCGDLLKNVSGQVTAKKNDEYIRKCAGKYAVNYILDNPGKFVSKMSTFTFKYWLFPSLEFYQRYIKTPQFLKFTLWTFWVLALVGLLVSFMKFKEFIPFYVIMLVIWFFSGMAFYLARYKAGLAPLSVFFAAGGLYTLGYFIWGNHNKKAKNED